MTLPKDRQASYKIEKQQLIQDIRKMNPDITEKQLQRYDIDDLRKIRMANTPQPNIGNTAGRPTMKYGGKMKKGYKSIGEVKRQEEVETIKARMERLAQELAELETAGSGKIISEQDIKYAQERVKAAENNPEKRRLLDDRIKEMRSPHRGMQQGGMADMSAAPMVQPRKKKKQSGFRTKYSKGGGVRATKYKI